MSEGANTDPSASHTALFLFKEDNPLRQKTKAIVTWPPFEYIILVVIVINCVILGFGLYLPEDNKTAQTLEKTEIYFLLIFIFEMVLKCVAFGFCLHPGSYIRNPWNIIDFFVIVVGILSFFPLGIELSVLRMLRVVRLLRLFRLVKILRNKN
ncbi:voltage-dependent calcium channel type A subunit alpha-1-like isoform X2 [Cimex lectularius]|uniref:Ion transport domain-containing protein n=1 Tax=Cimex lectularius TaxID=79782 RepID=A0A8I6RS41_CIMLE|nr:voltage-dependent calcium channel type A subunit alpha-1-like isoform X2 [Cimex lectularius]